MDLARLGSWDIAPKREYEMLEFAKKSEEHKFIQQVSFVLALHKLVRVGVACSHKLMQSQTWDQRQINTTVVQLVVRLQQELTNFQRFDNESDLDALFEPDESTLNVRVVVCGFLVEGEGLVQLGRRSRPCNHQSSLGDAVH